MLFILRGISPARIHADGEGHLIVSGRGQTYSCHSVEVLGPSSITCTPEDGVWLETESTVEFTES